ncbi:MAG: hypothetical protein F6K09_06375, partial [Merismopedia sp. SIO2A8]|nr:hypothetical protein [Merismopedia sp. SIO2A8]
SNAVKRLTASVAAIVMGQVAVLGTMSIMAPSAHSIPLPFRTRNEPTSRQFDACVETLMDLDIDIPTTVDVCGAAIAPKALAHCVEDIATETSLASSDALVGCVRVRQPEQTADCVVDLDEDFDGALSGPILGYCSRSLLPTIFKNCVQGIYTEEMTDPMDVMDACVEADYDAPQVFLPTFERSGPGSGTGATE